MKTIHDARYVRVIQRIKDARLECGLTQSQVADKLGWHRTAVSNIESRERRLDLLEAHLLCRVYGLYLCDLERLLDGEGGDNAEEPA